MDTKLRMKDKIMLMFEQELGKRGGGNPPVVRVERELFRAGGRIYLMNAKESIRGNIGRLLIQGMPAG